MIDPTTEVQAPNDVRVTAVVVTFDRVELLKEALQALQGQSRPIDHIVVVDNASTDGTQGFLDALVDAENNVEVVRLDRNVGGAGGFAEGMRQAHAAGCDWIWLMDDDAAPAPDSLRILLAQTVQPAQPSAKL